MALTTFLRNSPPTMLRGLEFLALEEIATILRATVVPDEGGGSAVTWDAVGQTECRIDPVGGRSAIVGGRIDESSSFIITVPVDAVIGTDDRIAIDGRGTFAVTAVHLRTQALSQRLEAVQV